MYWGNRGSTREESSFSDDNSTNPPSFRGRIRRPPLRRMLDPRQRSAVRMPAHRTRRGVGSGGSSTAAASPGLLHVDGSKSPPGSLSSLALPRRGGPVVSSAQVRLKAVVLPRRSRMVSRMPLRESGSTWFATSCTASRTRTCSFFSFSKESSSCWCQG